VSRIDHGVRSDRDPALCAGSPPSAYADGMPASNVKLAVFKRMEDHN